MKILPVRRINRFQFLRATLKLISGTVGAQLIPLLALPMLSRLYPPSMFALLALLTTCGALCGPLATGYYEWAITAPRRHQRARAVAMVAIACTLLFCLLITAIIACAYQSIRSLLHLEEMGHWIYAVAIYTCVGSFMHIANFWLLRAGRTGLLATIKMTHASVNMALAIAMGVIGLRVGLLYAFLIAGTMGGAWGLFLAYCHGLSWRGMSWRALRVTACHYREFPLFGSLPATCNNLAQQLPVLIVTSSFPLTLAGQFSVSRNLLMGSLLLVAISVSQLLTKHLHERMHARQRLLPFLLLVATGLAAVGTIGAVLIHSIGAWFFSLYFGNNWGESGQVIRQMTPAMPFILVGAGLGSALVAVRRIHLMAAWQILFAACMASLFLSRGVAFEALIGRIIYVEIVAYSSYILLIFGVVWLHDQSILR